MTKADWLRSEKHNPECEYAEQTPEVAEWEEELDEIESDIRLAMIEARSNPQRPKATFYVAILDRIRKLLSSHEEKVRAEERRQQEQYIRDAFKHRTGEIVFMNVEDLLSAVTPVDTILSKITHKNE